MAYDYLNKTGLGYLWSKIKDIRVSNINYVECETAANVLIKEVDGDMSFPGSSSSGQFIIVKFVNGSDGGKLKLKVGSNSAKIIRFPDFSSVGDTLTTPDGGILKGDIVTMVYHTEAFHIIAISHRAHDGLYSTAYASCTTATSTAGKSININIPFMLNVGSIVTVKFTNAVGAGANITYRSGSYPIYYQGVAIVAGIIAAGDTCMFVYDGTNFNLISIDRAASYVDANNTSY